MQYYFTQIQNKICENCDYAIRGDEQQFLFCGMPEGKSCMIEHFLPELVDVINSFDVLPKENPIIEIRCKVCSKCKQFKYGSCPLTGIGECTLDNNFQKVVSVIRTFGNPKLHQWISHCNLLSIFQLSNM